MQTTDIIPIEQIRAAEERLRGAIVRTPLVRLNVDDAPAEIYLKLENLQPIGSFKLRGAGNAMLSAPPEKLAQGVWTASAGNMAQGVAYFARRMGIPCTVVVPEQAPETKLAAITRLGGGIVKAPFDEWFKVFTTHEYPGIEGVFVHAFNDPAVMAGNGTIGLEIVEDLPDVDTIVIPFGGGGLASGIASAIRALKPGTKIFASEIETGAPLSASWLAGELTDVEYTASFVDGIGSRYVLPEMWQLAGKLLDGVLVTDLASAADAVRLLIERNRVIAEGASATALAVALHGQAGGGKVVSIISGGNIDSKKLSAILQGQVP